MQLRYVFSELGQGLRRNLSMHIAVVLTLFVSLTLVGLKGKENRRPDELSGGEQQRVAIARAFVNRPMILIADEPTGNLDPVTSWEIIQLLIQINELGTTVLMATHNQEIVNAMRRRVLALEHGTLVRDESGAAYEREY